KSNGSRAGVPPALRLLRKRRPPKTKSRRPLQIQRQLQRRLAEPVATSSTSTARRRCGLHRGKLGRCPSIPHTAGSQDELRCSAIHEQRPYRATLRSLLGTG